MSSLIQSMMKLPSGSSLERAKNCPGSFHGQQVDSTGEASKKGTENHERVELSIDRMDLSQVPVNARPFITSRLEAGYDLETEVAYAIDVETGTVRKLGAKLGRNYPPTSENEIKLTLDLVSQALVLDWKSRTRVTEARENLQIRAGAYAVWKTQDEPEEMDAGLAYLSDGYTDVAKFDIFQHMETLDILRSIVRGVKAWREGDALHEGDWCQYCPRFTSCDPKLAMIFGISRGVIPGEAELEAGDLGAAYEAWKRASQAMERIENAIKAGVRNQGPDALIQLSTGKTLAFKPKQRTGHDKEAVETFFSKQGAPVPMKTTYYDELTAVKPK